MFSRVIAALLPIIALLFGCAAQRHPASLPEVQNSEGARRLFSRWHVGVREPVARYEEGDDKIDLALAEIDTAAHLVGLLRRTNLFADVDFTQQLRCAPNIELVALAGRGDGLEASPSWAWLLTGSLGLRSEEGVAFSLATNEDESFDFPYPTTLIVGVFPAVANPILITGVFERWSVFGPDVAEELAVYLLGNFERLETYAVPSEPGACSSRPADSTRADS